MKNVGIILSFFMFFLFGCGGDDTTECIGTITIGFYQDSECLSGTEVATIDVDLSQTCFGWTRNNNGTTQSNSMTNFQLYRDRFCYTQHVGSLLCDTQMPTDKVAKLSECLQEPTGENLWAKVISGLDNFPDAPSGFACPISLVGQGSQEVNGCK